MKFDMDYIAHNNALTETNPYFKLFLTIILLIVTLVLDNLYLELRSIQYDILDKYDIYFIENSSASFNSIVSSISNIPD